MENYQIVRAKLLLDDKLALSRKWTDHLVVFTPVDVASLIHLFPELQPGVGVIRICNASYTKQSKFGPRDFVPGNWFATNKVE